MKPEPKFPSEPIAHTSEDGRHQLLIDHLQSTATTASEFASVFGSAQWGYLAGLWHDLGKYSDDFQRMIRGSRCRVDHSTAGGILAEENLGRLGRILAYAISGHHAGLPDWQSEASGTAGLAQRLNKMELLSSVLVANIPAHVKAMVMPSDKPKPGTDPALWVRMLFSCLVDADFLDTELFMDPQKATHGLTYPCPSDLLPLFTQFMDAKASSVEDTTVNRLRAQILDRCNSMACHQPGIFTLTVPTGGGKTLSSLGFALHHAVVHNKRRIIYVIPYTSIIEQTSDQFRQIFGRSVVEHHSNVNAEGDLEESLKQRLASENWDAPVIVTTSVQFFESLFASRTSRCRKLHNIVNSVVILDEAQLLPPEYLTPILMVLKELERNYGVTLVLCTATQPAFGPHKTLDFDFPGLPHTVEIMQDTKGLHDAFKRVEVKMPEDLNCPMAWEELAGELRQHQSVLCIVNRRDDCRQLYRLMPSDTMHLSALMCGAHRSEVIAEIRKRLRAGTPIRVVSTQLVEAGVDLDFPVVYRALAGLDSVAQAAGRCNREGRLQEQGQVHVFVPPSKPPPGHLRQSAEIGRRILSEATDDVLSPERFERFFRELYWLKGQAGLDTKGIVQDLTNHADGAILPNFRTAATKFHIIDDSSQAPVLVRYGKGEELIEILKKTGPDRWLMRRLQRYVVNLPLKVHSTLVVAGSIRELYPGIFVQEQLALYDSVLGFCADKSGLYEPDELVI